MEFAFSNCSSLSSLPDISKWEMNQVENIVSIFQNCSSLSSLPDISKWKLKKNVNMKDIFNGCLSLCYLPNIFIEEVEAKNKSNFGGCFSALNI